MTNKAEVARNWNQEYVVYSEGKPPVKLDDILTRLDHSEMHAKTLKAELDITRAAFDILQQTQCSNFKHLATRHKMIDDLIDMQRKTNQEVSEFKEKSDRRGVIIRSLLKLISTKSPDVEMIRRSMKIADEEVAAG